MVTHPEVPTQEAQTIVADLFLSPAERARAEAYHNNTPNSSGLIVFRGQALELIRWALLLCHDHPSDGTTFDDPAVKSRFIRALLFAGEIWSERVFEPYLPYLAASPNNTETAGSYDVLGLIRFSVEGTSRALRLNTALGRGSDLFEGLRDSDPEFEALFMSETGLGLGQYYLAQAALLMPFEGFAQRMQSPTNVLIRVEDYSVLPSVHADITKIIELESQSVEDLRIALWGDIQPSSIHVPENAPPYSYRALRQFPILKASGGRAVVLDFGFMKERLAVGPYFYYLSALNTQVGRVNDNWGRAFESYVCETLNDMFPTVPGLVARLTCNVQRNLTTGQIELYDACLNDGEEVVLFEVTAKFLADDSLYARESGTPTFEQALTDKYGSKLHQLVQNIATALVDDREGHFELCQVVYPVLVVHDHLLSTPITGRWFNHRFRELLVEKGAAVSDTNRIGHLSIAPLVVLTIDVLEALHTSIQEFRFRDLLRDYTEAHPDGTTSLREFLALDNRYKNRMLSNSRLRRRTKMVWEALTTMAETERSEA